MTDQGVSKEVPQQQQFITVNSLKDVADPAKKYLRRSKKRQLKLRAKVNNVQNGAGQLVDSTGLINFVLEGAAVTVGQTYDLTGSLRVVDYKLTINVTSATVSAEAITAAGNEQFSAAQIDANSGKTITNIGALLTSRIGQSFFAKPLNVAVEQKKAKATLADQNGAIEVEIKTVNKYITQEVLNNLSSDKVYLFSDMVINFTTENKLVGRFNYRSGIFEVNDHPINQTSNNNFSAKEYTEEEKQELTSVLQINEKKPVVKAPKNNNKSNKRNNNNNDNTNNGEKKVHKRNIAPTEPITVAELKQWNNNQTFVGKILTLTVESKTLKAKDGEEPVSRNYLKGTVADHTGVIDFDMAEKKDEPAFKVGDYVKFSMVMNKGRNTVNGEAKTGGHYIEVKKFGHYEVVTPSANNGINTENNLSTFELSARPKTENNRRNNKRRNNSDDNNRNNKGQRQNNNRNRSTSPNQQYKKPRNNRNHNDDGNVKQNNGNNNNNNNRNRHNNEDNQSNNRRGNNNRDQNNDNRKPNTVNQRYNNNNNNNNNNNSNNRVNSNNRNNNRNNSNNNRSNNNNNNNYNNSNSYNNNNRNNNNNNRSGSAPRPQKQRNLVDIMNLRPGERNSEFVGYVYEVQEFQKEINDKVMFFLKGRVADEKANIKFDIKKPRNIEIEEGKTYLFTNVINKVSNDGFHFVDVHRFGKILLAEQAIKNPNTSNANDADRSAIEYIKKTMEN